MRPQAATSARDPSARLCPGTGREVPFSPGAGGGRGPGRGGLIQVTCSSHPWKGPGYPAVPQATRGTKSIILLKNRTLPPPGLAKQGWGDAPAPRCTRESGGSTGKLGAMQEKQIFNDLLGL